MTELSGYLLETLRKGGEFILYRGRQRRNPLPVLVLAPVSEQPTPASLRQLEHEYSLAAELDPAWAARPLALILLVTGETIERLVYDDVEGAGAGILEQLLVGGTHADRTADRVIAIDIAWRPALVRDAALAEANLILDRGVALQLGGIAGVNDGTQHWITPCSSAARADSARADRGSSSGSARPPRPVWPDCSAWSSIPASDAAAWPSPS